MNNNIQKYTTYKPSGVEWLGEIPEHWEVKPGFTIIEERREKNHGLKVNTVLSLSYGNVVIKPEEKLTGLVPESFETYQLVYPKDIIIRPTDLQNDKTSLRIGLSKNTGIITSAYINIRVNPDCSSEYYYYYFYLIDITKLIYGLGSGLRQNLGFGDFKRFSFLLPPITEQTRIAEFLDRKTAQIDQAVTIKEKQIALLKERRQILIHRAVTRGINPEVKLKPSGVEWIGDIPEHWEVKRLKNIIKNLESGVSVNASESESANSDEVGVLKTSCVYNYRFESYENKKVFTSDLRRVNCSVKKGNIIISRMNAPDLVGASGYVTEDYPNLFLPDRLWQTVFHDTACVNSLWLSKVLIVKGFRDCITAIANGSSPSMKNISKGDFLNLCVPFTLCEEQKQIVTNIENISQKIATAINLKEQEIEKLKEYKSTLINSAVTGKIKI